MADWMSYYPNLVTFLQMDFISKLVEKTKPLNSLLAWISLLLLQMILRWVSEKRSHFG